MNTPPLEPPLQGVTRNHKGELAFSPPLTLFIYFGDSQWFDLRLITASGHTFIVEVEYYF